MPIPKNLKKIAKILEIAEELEPADRRYIIATWEAEVVPAEVVESRPEF